MRATTLWLALALPLAGCGDTPAAGFLGAATGALRSAPPPVTREEADASPFASILVSIGRGAPAYVVLHSALGSDRIWVAADRVAISTRGGRMVGTAGLGTAVTAVRPLAEDWLARPGPAPAETLLAFDGPEPIGFGATARCRLETLGRQPIAILGRSHDTVLVEERCRLDGGTSFVNRFWRDEAGEVWRSEQWLGRDAGVAVIEVLKPAA